MWRRRGGTSIPKRETKKGTLTKNAADSVTWAVEVDFTGPPRAWFLFRDVVCYGRAERIVVSDGCG